MEEQVTKELRAVLQTKHSAVKGKQFLSAQGLLFPSALAEKLIEITRDMLLNLVCTTKESLYFIIIV